MTVAEIANLIGHEVHAKRFAWDDGEDAENDPDHTPYSEMGYASPDISGVLSVTRFKLPDGTSGMAWQVGGQAADPKTIAADTHAEGIAIWVSESAYELLSEAGREGLVLKDVTDKNGKKSKRWVRATPKEKAAPRVKKEKPVPVPKVKKVAPPKIDKKAQKADVKGKAHAAVAAALENPAAADPKELAAHLNSLTVAEIAALNKAQGVKGGTAKADKIGKFLDHVKSKSPPEPKKAATGFATPTVTTTPNGGYHTTFDPGHEEAAARKYGLEVADEIHMGAQEEGGYVSLGQVAGIVRRNHPEATDNDIMAAASWLEKNDVVEGHALNEVQALTDGKDKRILPLNGGKDAKTATLWGNDRAKHYWMGHRSGDTRGVAAKTIAKLSDPELAAPKKAVTGGVDAAHDTLTKLKDDMDANPQEWRQKDYHGHAKAAFDSATKGMSGNDIKALASKFAGVKVKSRKDAEREIIMAIHEKASLASREQV